MPTIKKTVTINAPVEKVYQYVTDARRNPEWLPGLTEVKDVNEAGDSFRGVYKMLGVRFELQVTHPEKVPNQSVLCVCKGPVDSTWRWTFTAENDQTTRIDVTTDYAIPVPVLGKFAEALVLKHNEREAETAFANLKEILENS